MSSSPTTVPAATPYGIWAPLDILLELSKFRLSALVLVTTCVGFLLASGPVVQWSLLAWTLLGTALAAFGANACNQCIEVERDARMARTSGRPLPAGRISARAAWCYALLVGVSGPLILLWFVHPLAAVLAAACEFIYVSLYTPLKVRTPFNTIVGAVCGALPPMIGWVAASGSLGAGAWVLAAVLFVWQIPHFLALAWMYRDDYRAGGFRMLPICDVDGEITCQAIVLYSLTLVPVSLMMTLTGIAGPVYAVGALLLGCGLVAISIALYRRRTHTQARRVFLASVVYLPLLLGLMLVDSGPRESSAQTNTPERAVARIEAGAPVFADARS